MSSQSSHTTENFRTAESSEHKSSDAAAPRPESRGEPAPETDRQLQPPSPAGDACEPSAAPDESVDESGLQPESREKPDRAEQSEPEKPGPEKPGPESRTFSRHNIRIGRQSGEQSGPQQGRQSDSPQSPRAGSEAAGSEAAGSEAAGSEAAGSEAAPSGAPAEQSSPPADRSDVEGQEADIASEMQAAAGHPPAPHRPVPKPSRRDPLPADLQQQLDAVFGDQSMEEVLGAGDTDATVGQALEPESRIPAVVLRVDEENVFFSLGGRNEAIAPLRQFAEPPQVGQECEVVVKNFQAEEGLYEVAVPGATVDVADWSDLSEGAVVEARVTGSNTGGLECKVNSIRGFIPASQVGLFRVEEFADYIDQKLPCVVMEVNPQQRNLVLSHRAHLERQREEERRQLIEQLEAGQVLEGIVRKLHDFGAFVDLGGVDGLIHISQLSWDRVKHPSEVLKEGDRVKVKVEKVDRQTGKIGLSYRDLQAHPWADADKKFVAGTVVAGTITRVANFGAFVKLAPGIEGLIHISELSHQRVPSVNSVVKEGQQVEAKVLSVDSEAQRIALSLKELAPPPAQEGSEAVEGEAEQEPRDPQPRQRLELKGGTDRASGGEQFGLKW